MSEGRINITIKRSTRNRLADLGNKDDTYDSIIQKLLNYYEENGGDVNE